MNDKSNAPAQDGIKIGIALIVIGFLVDQIHKYYMLYVVDIGNTQPIEITSFFLLVLAWNTGISYGLLGSESPYWPYALTMFAVLLSAGFFYWLWTAKRALVSISLGLVIAGALSNALDRVLYGAVADFFYLSAGNYSWYIFNLADCWITFGAIGLIWDTFTTASDESKKRD